MRKFIKNAFVLVVTILAFSGNVFLQASDFIVYDMYDFKGDQNNVRSVFVDNDENIWFRHVGNLSIFNRTNWKKFPMINQWAVGDIRSMEFDDDGNKWLGSNSGSGVIKVSDYDTIMYREDNSNIPDDHVNSLKFIGNDLWCGVLGGIGVLSDTVWTAYDSTDCPALIRGANCIDTDQSGNIWFATIAMGLIKYDGITWTVFDSTNSDIPTHRLLDLLCDGNNIFMATYDSGFVKFDGSNWTVYNETNSIIPNKSVGSLAKEGNAIWIGTTKGLFKFENDSFSLWDTSNSDLPSNVISGIAIDANGNKWLATMEGLVAYKEGGVELGVSGGLAPPQGGIDVKVIPNPAEASVRLDYTLETAGEVKITVHDNSGNVVKSIPVGYSNEGENSLEFETEGLPTGVYFYNMEVNGQMKSGKFILRK